MKILKELFFLVLLIGLLISHLDTLRTGDFEGPVALILGHFALLASYWVMIRGWEAADCLGDKWYWINKPRKVFAELDSVPQPPQKKEGKMKIWKDLFFLVLFVGLLISHLWSMKPEMHWWGDWVCGCIGLFFSYYVVIRGWKAVTYFGHCVKRKKNNPEAKEGNDVSAC